MQRLYFAVRWAVPIVVPVICRRWAAVQRLRYRARRRQALTAVHQQHHTDIVPAQRHVGDRESVSKQGPAAVERDHRGDPAGPLQLDTPRRHERESAQCSLGERRPFVAMLLGRSAVLTSLDY